MKRVQPSDQDLERQLRAHYAQLTAESEPGRVPVKWGELLTASAVGAFAVVLVVAVATLLTPEPKSVGWDRQAVMSYLEPPVGALRRPEESRGESRCLKSAPFA